MNTFTKEMVIGSVQEFLNRSEETSDFVQETSINSNGAINVKKNH